MKAKHLQMWHHAEKREEYPKLGNWEKVITLIHAAFRGGELAAPCDWQTVVMIPKGGGTDFWGVGLVEVLWKAIYGIINFRLSSSIQFHDILHGFHMGRGTGTTTPKENLLQ